MNIARYISKRIPLFSFILLVIILNIIAMIYFSNPLSLDEIAEKEQAYLESLNDNNKSPENQLGEKKLFDAGGSVDKELIIDYCLEQVKRTFATKYKIAKMEPRDVLDSANRRGFEIDIYLEGQAGKPKGYVDCVVDTRFGDPRLLRLSREIETDPF